MEEQLWKACQNGKVEEAIKLLQNSQININWQDSQYLRTALYLSCENGHIEIVKLLLNNNRIDVNKGTKSEASPFWIACSRGHLEVVKVLLNDKRVDLNKVNQFGETPFKTACYYGQSYVVRLLLSDQRVDVSRADKSERTGFLVACHFGYVDIVRLCLNDKRIDINKPDKDFQTPFWIACQKGHLGIVEYIIASGRELSFTTRNKDGKNAIDIAREGEQKEKGSWEVEEYFQRRKKNCPKIVGILESFEKNQSETRNKLRIQLGLITNTNNVEKQKLDEKKKVEEEKQKKEIEEKNKKIEEENKKLEEEKNQNQEVTKIKKGSTYELEFNNKLYRLKTTAITLLELENDIRSKIKLQESEQIVLEFKAENGKFFILDDMEDLEEGITIKASIPQSQQITKTEKKIGEEKLEDISKLKISLSNPSVFLTHTWVKDELNRDNHQRVGTVNKLLKDKGFKTWFDEDKMSGDIDHKMAEGIDESDVILVFVTKVYKEKVASKGHDNCKGEFIYAKTRNKKMIPIVMEPCMRDTKEWEGPLGLRLGGHLYVDMSETDSEKDIKELVHYLKNKIEEEW